MPMRSPAAAPAPAPRGWFLRPRRAVRAVAVVAFGAVALGWMGAVIATEPLAAHAPDRVGPTSRPAPGSSFPATLSGARLFDDLVTLRPARDLVAYDVNVPFWSDGAMKFRWARLPPGRAATLTRDGAWELPPGTMLVKHFELPAGSDGAHGARLRRLETRVLVVRWGGVVDGATYRWRADHSDADRVDEATRQLLDEGGGGGTQVWQYLAPADCRTCHTPQAGGPLGITSAQLNREGPVVYGPGENQIVAWRRRGLLAGGDAPHALPRFPRLDDPAVPVETRARAWLDANCSHCHRPGGAPTELDLRFATPLAQQGLVNARPRIDLGIDGARAIAPNDAWRSVVLSRVEVLDGNRMPPLAHDRVDAQGQALLREWVASLPGPPVLGPPTIVTVDGRTTVPVTVDVRHPDGSATLRYTLDGSVPTRSSPAYAGPIALARPATVRARAFRDGHTRSIVVQQTFSR
ncbi:MAG TPA: chitobiase/beta-hexosaminidase C-terminal domain-containing protein [Tepidisphaeraceae bacterium]|nr:chitobiase/beta-hexosaminidase C-terminal domain-containing protein [Tepidisphaeraceae bacterium]